MTRFLDGPAKGQTLMLKRAAVFLRVVELGGKWDALDQADDEPELMERIYAYKITGPPGHCHLNIRGGRGGFYPMAEYALCAVQPHDATMRATGKWRAWCEARAAEVSPDLSKPARSG